MKSYSGIPYTTGKQAADDVKTQLVGFIKIPKWLLGLCLITVFYILFVCFSMYKIQQRSSMSIPILSHAKLRK